MFRVPTQSTAPPPPPPPPHHPEFTDNGQRYALAVDRWVAWGIILLMAVVETGDRQYWDGR